MVDAQRGAQGRLVGQVEVRQRKSTFLVEFNSKENNKQQQYTYIHIPVIIVQNILSKPYKTLGQAGTAKICRRRNHQKVYGTRCTQRRRKSESLFSSMASPATNKPPLDTHYIERQRNHVAVCAAHRAPSKTK